MHYMYGEKSAFVSVYDEYSAYGSDTRIPLITLLKKISSSHILISSTRISTRSKKAEFVFHLLSFLASRRHQENITFISAIL